MDIRGDDNPKACSKSGQKPVWPPPIFPGIDPKTLIILFDLDGTITEPRKRISDTMLALLARLREMVPIGIVSGNSLAQQLAQLGADAHHAFDYLFCENGLVAYAGGKLLHRGAITDVLSEPQISELVNWSLRYIAALDLPFKRGTFLQMRSGLINISPVGRDCSHEERAMFHAYDEIAGVRETMAKELRRRFAASHRVTISVGGQISMDVFPVGWDKSYCLRHLEGFGGVVFFGDRAEAGGNDHELFVHPRVVRGYSVRHPGETEAILREWLM